MRNAELQQKTGSRNRALNVPVQNIFIPNSAFRIPHSEGFTLVEVLIATAIMAGIVTVIYSSFFTTSRNVEQAEASRDTTDLARTLVARLSVDIANAFVNPTMNATAVTTFFQGKKGEDDVGGDKQRHDSLTLTTLTNWRRPGSKETDLWEVGYFFKQRPEGNGLVMMRREKREPSKEPVETELTDRVEVLQFRYHNGITWVDEWNSATSGLPNVVEITLALDDGSHFVTEVEVGR